MYSTRVSAPPPVKRVFAAIIQLPAAPIMSGVSTTAIRILTKGHLGLARARRRGRRDAANIEIQQQLLTAILMLAQGGGARRLGVRLSLREGRLRQARARRRGRWGVTLIRTVLDYAAGFGGDSTATDRRGRTRGAGLARRALAVGPVPPRLR